MLVDRISKYLDIKKVKYVSNSIDKRNYRVNFDKLRIKLKYKIKYDIDYGIKEIIQYLKNNKKINYKKMGNYKVNND